MNKRILFIVAAVFLLAACGGTTQTAVKSFQKGDELAFYDFTEPASFEEGIYADGAARLEVSGGTYNISLTEGDSTFYYGQWGEKVGDVVIDVEARQLSDDPNTTYGIMCRARGEVGLVSKAVDPSLASLATEVSGSSSLIASQSIEEAEATREATNEAEATSEATSEANAEATSEATSEATTEATAEPTVAAAPEGASNLLSDRTVNNGDGYLFLLSGGGRFAIMRSVGRTITPLVNWTESGDINKGAAQNRIRAVCMGTYLAIYANGKFLGDTSDDTYTSGQVGLLGAASGRAGVELAFDNLTVSAAEPG
ncbi:MAG: hypothetical protein R3E39_15770 [Anaerolineae bacterium]